MPYLNDQLPTKEPKPRPSIYIMSAGNTVKIGVSKNVEKRKKQLQTGCPEIITIEYQRERADAYKLEKKLHRDLCEYRTQGEWYILPDDVTIRDVVVKCYSYLSHDWN